jgi:hypothetical protein
MRCWVNGGGLPGAWTGASSQYRARDGVDLTDHRSVTGQRQLLPRSAVAGARVLDDVDMAVLRTRGERAGSMLRA